MVTFNVYKSTATGIYVEGVCLASDTKPVDGITNGSILFAVNTSDGTVAKYMFNQSAATWVEVQCPCSGGGGSGGGSDLPEVSASDNGKLLTVVSGEWAAAQPAAKVVRCKLNYSQGVFTAAKKASELIAADLIVFDVTGGAPEGDIDLAVCTEAWYVGGSGYTFKITVGGGSPIELSASTGNDYPTSGGSGPV